jgi:hypothetical protein
VRHPREKAPSTALSHEVASIISRGRGYRHRTLAGRIVPVVNGVGVVGHGGHFARLDPGQRRGYIFAMPRRTSKKDSPAKLAGRMKRRWRVVLPRSKGEILGTSKPPMWRRPKQPQRSSLAWTKSSATGSWCRSLADDGGAGTGPSPYL